MTIQVSKVQRSTLRFDRNSTLLDLVQALTENLGGEWDDARLEPDLVGNSITGGWTLHIVLEDSGEEPNRQSRMATEDGKHVAEQGFNPVHGEMDVWRCSCGFHGPEEEMVAHMNWKAGGPQ